MPVGVNNEALGQGAIFGFDGTNYRVVGVDTSGKLLVALTFPITQEVTQDDPTLLKATVYNTPRIPPGVTDLSSLYYASIANTAFVEMLSGTNNAAFNGLDGRVVASGKRLVIAWGMASVSVAAGKVNFYIGYDNTFTMVSSDAFYTSLFAPSVFYYCVGNGSKKWKIAGYNATGSTATTSVAALCWEEDIF